MKLAIFCNTISIRRGAERLLLDVLNNFPKNLDITIFTRDYGRKTAFKRFENYNVIKFSNFFDLLKIKKFDVLLSWIPFPNYLFASIVKTFNKNNKNAKHIWYSGGAYLPNRKKPKIKDFTKKILSDWAIKKTDEILVLTNYLKKEIKIYNNRKSKAIYCGLETKDFQIKKFKKNKIPLILFPTFISKIKGVYDVYNASKELLKENYKFKLIITGGGPDKEKLQELAKLDKVDKNILIKDNIEEEEFKKLYNQCDFVLYPPFSEPFGLVPLEAMLYNKVVIYRDEGGPHELLKNTKNLPFKTKEELSQQIKKLLDNPDLAKELGKGAREFAIKNFDIKITVDKLLKEIKKL